MSEAWRVGAGMRPMRRHPSTVDPAIARVIAHRAIARRHGVDARPRRFTSTCRCATTRPTTRLARLLLAAALNCLPSAWSRSAYSTRAPAPRSAVAAHHRRSRSVGATGATQKSTAAHPTASGRVPAAARRARRRPCRSPALAGRRRRAPEQIVVAPAAADRAELARSRRTARTRCPCSTPARARS